MDAVTPLARGEGEPPRRPICPARYHASLAVWRAHSRRHVRRALTAAWYPAT
ncbi:MAG: hypothetical protein LUD54_06370 [Oscillospiraceae bacterium]|nr:hypothetical protein [Oscillospiraceae bacterium]